MILMLLLFSFTNIPVTIVGSTSVRQVFLLPFRTTVITLLEHVNKARYGRVLSREFQISMAI
jgi:hypothetical protein